MLPRRIMRNRSEKTVQAVILNANNEILLVHEKDEGPLEKPPGWGLPGGGVDQKFEGLIKDIENYLYFHKIGLEPFYSLPATEFAQGANYLSFLACIKECLQETGFLVYPTEILFEEPVGEGHVVQVFYADIIAGTIERKSNETDGCDWFALDKLPEGNIPAGVYYTHRGRIDKAMKIIQARKVPELV